MKSHLAAPLFKLTTLSISLSLISTVAISSSTNLKDGTKEILEKEITATPNTYGVYSEGVSALSKVDLLIKNTIINSDKSSVFIDKRIIANGNLNGDVNIITKAVTMNINAADGDGIYVAPNGTGNVNITTDKDTIINVRGQGNNSFGIAVQADKNMTGNIDGLCCTKV